MTSDILARAGVDQETDDKARRAVQAFRALQPTLSAYARAMSGRKNVRVEAAARDNGSTDGTRIFYRPPIALGDNTKHNTQLCNKRDADTDKMLCSACAIREQVLVTVYHEIAHICFDTFQPVSEYDKVRAIDWAIREAKGQYREKIEARIKGAPKWKTQDYLNLTSLINEYLPTLINALEDARVNRELFKFKPGVQRMFDADTMDVFREGVEHRNADGSIEYSKWSTAPLNSQALIGVFCMASGYTRYEDWLHPTVAAAMRDDQLNEIVSRMDSIRSAAGVYNLSFHVLQRLRELGFCGTPQDPDPEPESKEDDETGDDNSSSPGMEDAGEDATEESSASEAGDSGESGESSSSGASESDRDLSSGDSTEGESEEEGTSGDSSEESRGSSSEQAKEGVDDERESDSDEMEMEADRSNEGGQSGEPDDSNSDGTSSQAGSSDTEGSDPQSQRSSASEEKSDSQSPDPSSASDADSDSGEDESGQSDQSDGAGDSRSDNGDSRTEASSGGSPESGHSNQIDGSQEQDNQFTEDSASSRPESGAGDQPDVIDTGADDGYGGTELLGDTEPTPEMGEPSDADPVIKMFGDHEEKPKTAQAASDEEAMDRAIIQGVYFTTPSDTVWGVREHFYGKPIIDQGHNFSLGWQEENDPYYSKLYGTTADTEVPNSAIAPALMKLRRAFTDNQRGLRLTGLKSGKINNRALGTKAPFGDPRLFRKDVLPGKKDYYVCIGMDISGSTIGQNIALEKRAVMAQCEMLARVGVDFEVFAHTGDSPDRTVSYESRGYKLDIYHIKDLNEPWTPETKKRLNDIQACNVNLDGHALEFLRKKADLARATDKVILYYSDGKFPQSNSEEELEIFQREMRTCRQKNYTLLGVGIRTDSPRKHGLDTVEVHGDDDLVKVVEHLERRLSGTIRR